MSFDRPLEDLDVIARVYANRCAASPGSAAELRAGLIAACLPFAGRLARRYGGRGEPVEDLEQVARLGLIHAIDRYDPGRGSFTAYAVITVAGELKRHFRDRARFVHVPRRLQDLNLAANRASADLAGELARTPRRTEVAGRLGVTERELDEAARSAEGYAPMSLNAPIGSGEIGDLFGGTDHALDLVDDRVTLAGLLLRLPARERQLLALRFFGDRTQAEIAEELGVSQMHVSRLLARTLAWLREAMLDDAPPLPGSTPGGLEVTWRRHGTTITVRSRGEIDRDTAGRLRVALLRAVAARPARVVADLSGTPLVDAAGIAALADAAVAARAAGLRVRVTGASPAVRHVLRVAGPADLDVEPI